MHHGSSKGDRKLINEANHVFTEDLGYLKNVPSAPALICISRSWAIFYSAPKCNTQPARLHGPLQFKGSKILWYTILLPALTGRDR